MKPSICRRIRHTATHDAGISRKDNQQEQSFFGLASQETFFQPTPVIHRKCADCKEDDTKLQRQADKKEDERLDRMEDKDDKVLAKEAGTSPAPGKSVSINNYIGSLSGKGQPLPAQTNYFFSSKMGHDFSNVKIHTGKEAAESAKDINAKAYTYGYHIVFNKGEYNIESEESKKLLTHELVHIIQQNKNGGILTREKVFLRPDVKSKSISGYIGWIIGIKTFEEVNGIQTPDKEVKVVREIGSGEGYDEKLQAISVCRLANIEPAGVVRDYYGMWHAFEVTENFFDGLSSVNDFSPPNREIYGLPSSIFVESERKKNPRSDLYASLALGVSEKDILFNISSAYRETGKINFNSEFEKTGKILGLTGPENWGDSFEAGQSYATELATNLLDTPQKASGVLFHEASHLNDDNHAQLWVAQYQKETGRLFISSNPAPFQQWLLTQVPKKGISLGDAELISEISSNFSAATEARAYTHTILASIHAGALDVAKDQAEAYVSGEVALPQPGSNVVLELTSEIKSAYAKMPIDMQTNLKDIIVLAKSKNPGVWLSQIIL